ncbi:MULTISPECIES: transaldolase [Rhizobium/Agrobacterium group]|uniref:Transaldolase n=2 Tax=Rhizobium/Agrobacterium group TaxID=227290 RepID=TAL_ALLAM|nr:MULTISPECIES: transaldolase [Rhizobium/Agrobacterium group]B9JST0.1 RecName: Full=Transaldolase [Allorhizobium ampelinum S4]ACM37773.1 transaldolase [Allorhizobium ampelinum S4]MBF2714872.1 transaldolase [Agrobacterium vitis]MCF1433939.1 transaldolase [Allorhizobium ampelinum]MCF1447498.1 transaldolase [Allorhizobium ampelinum]MUO29239.1 transaldolase [Agrobacterium vitis]
MTSKLEQLRAMTTVVADTGDIEAVTRLKPVDCTTNPTIVLKALGTDMFADAFEEAIKWGKAKGGASDAVTEAIADRLAISVGAALAKIVPGRVSTEVDADLSFDTQASLNKARAIIAQYKERGIEKDRILIKLASTWEGIRAAEVLQKEGIDCNLTLLFSKAQAIACAEAKVFLISPFVGRILDWYKKSTGENYTSETDPGVVSVRQIYNFYKVNGIETIVMGASFRNAGEIEALAGCDRLTISPALLDELDAATGDLPRVLSPEKTTPDPLVSLDEKAFRWALNEDAMATEKLSEGIRAFAKDLGTLRGMVAKKLAA